MRTTYLLLTTLAIVATTNFAHAKKTAVSTVLDQVSTVEKVLPVVDPTPLPTVAPTPLPTISPTPLPTVSPTVPPTPSPVPTPPFPISTPTPLPIVSVPGIPSSNPKPQIVPGSRSDVSVTSPVTGQQIQQAAQALSATPLPTEQSRVLLNVAPHTASSTLSDPGSDYSYGAFTGLNRNLTLGLDSLATILAAAGIYVAVRSGSILHA